MTVTLLDESRICYTYDQADRCIREQHKDKKGEIDQIIEYTYDHVGNITSQTDGEGNVIIRSYNCRNLLDRRTDALGSEDTFQYDLRGNIVRSKNRMKLFNYKSDNLLEAVKQCRDNFIVIDNADILINDEIRGVVNQRLRMGMRK